MCDIIQWTFYFAHLHVYVAVLFMAVLMDSVAESFNNRADSTKRFKRSVEYLGLPYCVRTNRGGKMFYVEHPWYWKWMVRTQPTDVG